MSTVKFVSVPTKRLAESITGASTSFKVNSISGWDGNDLTSADFGSRLWVVFRNSAGTLMEIMEVDPTTITSASSAITIITRGLKFTGDQSTSVSGNKLTWVKGDTIIEFGTHVPQLLEMIMRTIGDQSIDGVKTFTSSPIVPTPTTATQVAHKNYVDVMRVQTVTDAATITPNTDSNDSVDITAIAQNFTIANPTGTPSNFKMLVIRILDNGTGRTITFGNQYRAMGNALPTTTIASKYMILGFFWNTTDSKWDLVSLVNQN